MGSGLILLVIVGAWLAVLVPMALRSHDASNALGTVDKFHDAMRVLSRRDGVARAAQRGGLPPVGRDAEPPARASDPGSAPDDPADPADLSPRPAERPALTAADRRRRALLALVAAAVVTGVLAVVGPTWLLAPHLLADALLVAFLVGLHRSARARAEREERERRPAARTVPAAAPVTSVLVVPRHVVGIPDRMPSRAVLDPAHVVVPAARTATAPAAQDPAVAPARGAQGEPWQPVPVPVPMYVTAPTAPRSPRPVRTLAEPRRAHGEQDGASELDVVLERRRAVGD